MHAYRSPVVDQRPGGWWRPAVSALAGLALAAVVLTGVMQRARDERGAGSGEVDIGQAAGPPPAPTEVAGKARRAATGAPVIIYIVSTEQESAAAWERHRELHAQSDPTPTAAVLVAPVGAGPAAADWIPDIAEQLGLWVIVVDLRTAAEHGEGQ